MNKRKIFFCGLIGSMLFSEKVFAADFHETDPSSIAGYYFSEELSFVFMDNGIVYDVNPEHMESGVLSENYTVSSDGNNYLVKIQDNVVCLSKQNEKEKADNGGVYYALYSRYEGNVNEMTYQEGAQVLFDDCIFDNDYEVIIREPLANFFSVADNYSATIESRGYKSPEAAVTAYIEGFRNNDIDQMLSVFAVETYVKNFNLEKQVERIGAYSLGSGVVPSISKYADKLNLENRRSNIIGRIRNQYMTLTEAKVIADDTAGIVGFDFSEMTAEEFVKDIFTDNDEKLLSNIGFDGIFIAPQRISETYATENNRNYLQKEAETLGADKIESVVAFLMINDSPYLLCMDTVCYDNIWYALNLSGNIGAIIGRDRYNGGLIKLGNAELEILLEQNDYGKYVGSQTETDDQKDAAEMEEVTETAEKARERIITGQTIVPDTYEAAMK